MWSLFPGKIILGWRLLTLLCLKDELFLLCFLESNFFLVGIMQHNAYALWAWYKAQARDVSFTEITSQQKLLHLFTTSPSASLLHQDYCILLSFIRHCITFSLAKLWLSREVWHLRSPKPVADVFQKNCQHKVISMGKTENVWLASGIPQTRLWASFQ